MPRTGALRQKLFLKQIKLLWLFGHSGRFHFPFSRLRRLFYGLLCRRLPVPGRTGTRCPGRRLPQRPPAYPVRRVLVPDHRRRAGQALLPQPVRLKRLRPGPARDLSLYPHFL